MVLGTLVAWITFLGFGGIERVTAQPVATMSERSLDLSTIKQGEKIAFSFFFKNTGDAPLVFSKVDVQCGCTVARFTKRPIMPGETGEVRLTYKAGKGKNAVGYQHKTATLYTNEGGKASPRFLNFSVRVE